MHSLLKQTPHDDVFLADDMLSDSHRRSAMHSSKYCLVLMGSSNTNTAELSDAIVHGCVPVIISDDFHPPLDLHLQWASFAIFLGTSAIPDVIGILRGVTEDDRLHYFQNLVLADNSALSSLDWHQRLFWFRIFQQAGTSMRKHAMDMNPVWWESALLLRATALELYMGYLDGIDCPRHLCTSHDVAAGIFGCADAETLMPALATVYRRLVRQGQNPVFVDGGANTGKLTYKILASLGELFARRLLHDQPETEGRVSCPLRPEQEKVAVISVEPSAKNFRQLELMAEQQLWGLEDWVGFNGALADYDGNGSLSIEPDWSLDEVATLQPPAGDSRARQGVEVITLSTLRDRYFKERDIILLKLDVEGAELAALLGAQELLLAGRVRFIVFEYSRSTWKTRLLEMVRYLFAVGYVCMLITDVDLFPVSGILWDDAYEKIVWSNFLCTAIDDADLRMLMSAHVGDDARTSNIVRALHELYS